MNYETRQMGYFLAGIGLGTVLGVLLAPGEETRDYLLDKVDEGRAYLAVRGRHIRQWTREIGDQGRELLARQKETLNSTLEIGKKVFQIEKA